MRVVAAGDTTYQVAAAFVFAPMHVLALFGYGRMACPLLRRTPTDAQLVIVPAVGYGALGLLLLLLGHLGLLTPPVLVAALVPGVALSVGWPPLRSAGLAGPDLVARAWRRSRPLTVLVIGSVIFLALSATAAPTRTDEVAYHWASPLYWASHHALVASPYRFSNGAALAEIQYTLPAVFSLSTAAHLLHLFMTALLGAGLALLARQIEMSRLWAASIVVGTPVILVEASVAYNDIAFACLTLAALCAVVAVPDPQKWWIVGILLSIAASVKILALLAIVSFFLVSATWGRDAGWAPRPWRSWVKYTVAALSRMAIPICVAALVWVIHTWLMIHRLLTSTGYYLASVHSDRLAPGRIPSLVDIVTFPFFWITTAILGDREPYGGRVGVVVLVFLPVSVALWRHASGPARRAAQDLGLAALAWLAVDLILSRTRFNIYGWSVLALATLVLAERRAREPDRIGGFIYYLYVLCVLAGALDALRKVPLPMH